VLAAAVLVVFHPLSHSKRSYHPLQHGLAKHAMEVYAKAARTVPKAERMSIYELYLAKASEFFGIGKASL
jgi:hypothetical protein